MEEDNHISLQEKVLEFLKQNTLVSGLFFGGLIFLGIGLIQYLANANNSNSVEFVSAQDVKSASVSAEKVFIDVSGEVQNPGVYKLESTARVQDALVAAGGLGVNASRDYIAKSINLASPLKDGMKIYIPKAGEMPSSASSVVNTANTSSISVNSSSQSELEALPGVGPVTAGNIIAGRPYSSVDELFSKKVVGKSVYDKIKDNISL